jgi:cyclophilin family peptidyl-prolyl cis-trans isomerase
MLINIWPQLENFGYAGVDIRLYDDVPIATANFINLTKMGIYNNTIFFKAINNSLVEGGDPTGTGYGDPSIVAISDELPNRHSNVRGTIAMAKNLGSNLTTSLFIINLANNSFLDDQYVVFGEVTQGMYVFDTIGNATVDANYRPLLNYTMWRVDLIQHITVDVVVIPEIPSSFVLLLFMIATLLAVIAFRTRRAKLNRTTCAS